MRSNSVDKPFVIIIDSNRGTRRLDNTRSTPASLKQVDDSQTVLDWILHALSNHGAGQVTYVGNYQIQKVIQRYPNLDYRFQTNPQIGGEVAGLGLARPPENRDCVIVRASTILVPQALDRLCAGNNDISVGYYGAPTNQRFVGLISLAAGEVKRAFDIASDISRQRDNFEMEDWIAVLSSYGINLRSVDLDSLAAPMQDTLAVARTVFGGKGRALEQVKPLLKTGTVLEQFRFTVSEWVDYSSRIILQLQSTFPGSAVIVRSSAGNEDGLEESLAGRFTSVLNVDTHSLWDLRTAVDQVVDSYTTSGRAAQVNDEVLVQPHVGNLSSSGVLLTRDPVSGAPYYVLNIDRESGRSDSVTSGTGINVDTIYISQIADRDHLAPDIQACITLAKELEDLTHIPYLDIEFGISRDGTVYLFQVRPIAGLSSTFELADDDLSDELFRMVEFLDAQFQPHPTLAGKTTVLGTMPDWNPAEMIGISPRPLALSLYQRLIGADAWSSSRVSIGYIDVRPEPLIVSLGGQPYVDVRASLNSFLPVGLDHVTAKTWTDYCIDLMSSNPRLHDKIEFEVAITCLAFDFDYQSGRLKSAGLDDEQIKDFKSRLLLLTDNAIKGIVSPIEDQLHSLCQLNKRRQLRSGELEDKAPALARNINALLADCERYGVVPFAVMARYAFIATDLLRSLAAVDIFSKDEYETILSHIPTVASDVAQDFSGYTTGIISKEELLRRYGHLRPSSYDITSPNYTNSLDIYIENEDVNYSKSSYPDKAVAKAIFDRHSMEIGSLMESYGFEATPDHLCNFILKSIPGREWVKFELMKSVDATLESIAHFGAMLGFSREDMSFLPIEMVVRGARDSANSATSTEFRRTIEFNKKRWNLTSAIRLPHLVTSTNDIGSFLLEEWTPNFISTKRVVAPPVLLGSGVVHESLKGRIVLISAADPGYDWIFSHSIAGLVTEYGGVASHMAIRAAEFGIPAAIGCGQKIFDWLNAASLVELDCVNRKVKALS